MDLKLFNRDMDLVNGKLSWVTGADAKAQAIEMKLATWLGEEGTVYDRSAGVPYLQTIFGRRAPDLTAVQAIIEAQVLAVPGILSIQLDLDYDQTTRVLSVTGTARAAEGDVDFSRIIKAAE